MDFSFLSFIIWVMVDNRHILFVFGITLLIIVTTDWILGMTKAPGNGFVFWTNIICRVACLYFAFVIVPICLFSFSLTMKQAGKDFGDAMYVSLDEKTNGGVSTFKQHYRQIMELFK